MRDVGTIRQYVREFLDLEAEDLSDVLIDTWIVEGYRKLVRATRRVPFFEASWDLDVVAGESTYNTPEDLQEIDAIEGPWGNLVMMDEAQARHDYNLYRAVPQSGQPEVFTRRGGQVRIWPTPDADYTLRVLGWRKPADWFVQGAGSVPDMPEEWEDALLAWVMHRAYAHQDDPELSSMEAARFQAAAEEAINFDKQGDLAQPLVMGGGRRRSAGMPAEYPHPTWGWVR